MIIKPSDVRRWVTSGFGILEKVGNTKSEKPPKYWLLNGKIKLDEIK